MISIRLKDFENSPARLIDATSINQIRRASETQNGKIYTGNVYRHPSVVQLLRAYSIGKTSFDPICDKAKCYYCESQGEEKGVFDVEHYRSKDGLSTKDKAINEVHHGYYWLGNEWSNLLLGCRACNGSDAKGIRFPIATFNRKTAHQPVDAALNLNRVNCIISSEFLISESPILLNPEYDTPEEHLTFDESGQIFEKNHSFRGKQTIEILRLNRGALHISRKEIVDQFQDEINTIIDYHAQSKMTDDLLHNLFFDICTAIHQRKLAHVAYTLWGRYINENFETIFVAKLPAPYQKILRVAYQAAYSG